MLKSISTTKDTTANTPGPSEPDPDADKVPESKLREQQCQDARLLDKDFGAWCNKKISKGSAAWKICAKMRCDHGGAFKDHQHSDPVSLPLDYMKSSGVFKATKTNVYDLCCFYRISATGEFPAFPAPRDPTSSNMLRELLEAARAAKCANLLMVFAGEFATAICLLRVLHDKDSMKCLALETKPGKQDMDSKMTKKLSFCPFCLYHGSNNLSYMNHFVITHYNAAYGCGKCLKVVLLTGQQAKSHLKSCPGFPKDDTASSSDREPAPPVT